jgi:hypothetical protein
MRVLPLKWQRAVTALFITGGNKAQAARHAGYKAKGDGIYVVASRIFADVRVRAAIREVAAQQIDIAEPELLATTLAIMRDSNEPARDRLRAVAMVWDRANPVVISVRYREQFSSDRTFVQMGISDVPPDGDIAPHARAQIIEGYPEHERDARSKGEPMLGEGKVYKTPESEIIEDTDPGSFPIYWRWGYGIDLGIDHPFAAVLMCHDVDQDVIHLVAELRIGDAPAAAHVAQMRQLEKRIFGKHMDFRVAWPADAGTRDKGSGEPAKNLYRQFGLHMMAEPATLAGLKGAQATSLEGGVQEIDARERAGKWKVSRGMLCYLEERRLYHRKDGEIVRLRDDTLAAARYGMMMRRYFKPLDESGGGVAGTVAWHSMLRKQSRQSGFARGTPSHPDGDMNPFTGE